MLATGYAFERQDASNINKTSFIENCETSAVGRALGFIGLGSEKSIASAEEVDNAIKTQEAIADGKIADPVKKTANVTEVPKVPEPQKAPEPQKVPDVLKYLAEQREELMKAREITKAENAAIWKRQVEVLKGAGKIPNKALSNYTQAEAEDMVCKMYTCFDPHGTELKPDEGKTA